MSTASDIEKVFLQVEECRHGLIVYDFAATSRPNA
jgi:hypothetical protein